MRSWRGGGWRLDSTRHMASHCSVLPRPRIAVPVEEHADGERAETRQTRVRHHDDRRVADETHRNDDWERGTADAATVHLGVEPPLVVANLLNARNVVAIWPRCPTLSSGDGKRANQARAAHPVGKLAL